MTTSEEKKNEFRALFETMNLGVSYQNSKGEIIKVNPAALRILGLTEDQMKGKTSIDPSWKAIKEDGADYPGETHPSMLALKTGVPVLNKVMGVFNVSKKKYCWIKIDAIPQFKNGEKKPYQVYTTFDDITTTKETELQLKENEKRYIRAQKMGKVGNWEYDIKTGLLWGSDETLRIFGLNPKKNNFSLNYFEKKVAQQNFVRQAMINLIEKGEKYDIQYEINIQKKTKIVHSKAKIIYDTNGKILKIAGVIQDISKKYKRKIELKESEDKFFKVFKNSSNAIILKRFSDFKIINSNEATFKVTGFTSKELKGLKLSKIGIWKSKKDYKKYENTITKKNKIKGFETEFTKKNGENRIWQISGEIIQIKNEKFILTIIEDVTEVRNAEIELKKQRNFTTAMTENQPAAIIACDEKGKLALFNKAAKKWHGIDVMKIPEEKWAENYNLFKTDGKTILKTEEIPLVQAFNDVKVVNFEMLIKAKNQKPRFVICNGAPFFDALGNKLGALVVMNDITHQKNIEHRLKNSRAQIKKALSEIERSEFLLNESGKIAKIGAWEFNSVTKKRRWSNQVFKIYGLPIGKVPPFEETFKYYTNGSAKILKKAINNSLANNAKFDLELSFKNAQKEKLWVNVIGYPILNEKKEVISIRGIMQDITDQKLIREKIEKTQEMHSLLANNTNDIICLQEPDSTFKYISPSIKNLLGYEQTEFIGKQVFSIVHKDDIVPLINAMKKKNFNNSSTEAYPFRALHKNGYFIWLEFLSSPVYKDGKINYFVTSARDITQWILAKEEIQQYQTSLQKLTTEITIIEEKQKKKIASNIHDHLSQSLVISKMRIKKLKKNPQVNVIYEDLQFIESHISDALENSRKITYELSPPILYQLGVIEALNWLVEDLENKYKIKFRLQTAISSIKISELKSIILYRSIQEILTNAIKHADASLIKIDIKKTKKGVNIFIVDDGVGFDTSILNEFKNQSGSGFGLFTVQERIKNLQGRFTITSKINKGTSIKIFIPQLK
ncbi:PAS domain S-box protein [Polaribacter batillariae]|uniref:Oxygen sensor histidine kinase NreB n=1 Tax=Polaribacter batillariae TaxID=2808900 RepID=A0ABX7SVS1_9FLAO|nr:PAS domain S-box protein [Polaribacter batillariae]QTD36943.1 PAS domain S-box protein [Polaribacter batillariae]